MLSGSECPVEPNAAFARHGKKADGGGFPMAMTGTVKFFNGERGYVRCTLTPKTWQSDFRTIDRIDKPGAPITTRASYVVEAGVPGAKRA